MAKIGFLIITGPWQFQNWETAANIADAALDKGHEVSIFLYLDGVYNPIKLQALRGYEVMPKDRFSRLLSRGAKIFACVICINARGLADGRDYIDGVRVGSLNLFADMIGEMDRLIQF